MKYTMGTGEHRRVTSGPGPWKVLGIVVAAMGAMTTAAGFIVSLGTKADIRQEFEKAAPASIVEDVAQNTKARRKHAAAIAKLDKEAAVANVEINGKLNLLLATQAQQANRSPYRKRQMAKVVEQIRESAREQGVADPFEGVQGIPEAAPPSE